MKTEMYDRISAKAYAKRWAFERNPNYYCFDDIGGDCTNFASQCVYAGSRIMNFTPDVGWYYRSTNNRAPAWTGVEEFYDYLTTNEGYGPFGHAAPVETLDIGDLVQLGNRSGFYHCLIVIDKNENGEPLLAAHTIDAYNRPLSTYSYWKIRGVHILAVRK